MDNSNAQQNKNFELFQIIQNILDPKNIAGQIMLAIDRNDKRAQSIEEPVAERLVPRYPVEEQILQSEGEVMIVNGKPTMAGDYRVVARGLLEECLKFMNMVYTTNGTPAQQYKFQLIDQLKAALATEKKELKAP